MRVVAVVALLAFGLYAAWKQQQRERVGQLEQGPKPAAAPLAPNEDQFRDLPAPVKKAQRAASTIGNQQIRDENGRVVFRGDVDLGPTLDRIESGGRLDFSHDGTTFQNRERRLPSRPAGYYREYVHRTPGVSGPGPQRIVIGQEGEIYYTPDHYRTFQRLDNP